MVAHDAAFAVIRYETLQMAMRVDESAPATVHPAKVPPWN
jgi:hypothetical protein